MGDRPSVVTLLRRWVAALAAGALAVTGALVSSVPAHAEPSETASITGRVLAAADDSPLSGIAVMLLDAATGEYVEVDLSGGVWGLPAEADGVYGSDDVPPGDYHLLYVDASLARAAAEAMYETGYLADAGTGARVPTVSGAQVLHVLAGDEIVIPDVRLGVGGTITGGTNVMAPGGQAPLTRQRVEHVRPQLLLHGAEGWQPVYFDSPYFGDDTGSYVMSGLPAGDYCLYFEMRTGRGAYTGNIKFEPTYRGGTSCDDADLVSVSAGATTSGIDTLLTYQEPSAPAVAEDDFAEAAEDGTVAAAGDLVQGESISIEVGTDRVGEWVAAFAHSTPTALGGWYRIGVDGTISVPIPADAPTGSHSLVVQDADNDVLGWESVTIEASTASTATSISGTLQFPIGLDAAKDFGKVTAYSESPYSTGQTVIADYDPATGAASFEITGLDASGGYLVQYAGPGYGANLDQLPVPGGFTHLYWTGEDGGSPDGVMIPVATGTDDIEFEVSAAPYIAGSLRFPTGLDPEATFVNLLGAGGGNGPRIQDPTNWGDYEPSTGVVPFVVRLDEGQTSAYVYYHGLAGDPASLPVPAGFPARYWDGAGGSVDAADVVAVPAGTSDLEIEIPAAAGYTGTIEFPAGFEPTYPYVAAHVGLAEDAGIGVGTVETFDAGTSSAAYRIQALEPGSYHPLVSPFSSDAAKWLPQLSDGSITVAAGEDPMKAIAAAAGVLTAVDFEISTPAFAAGTLTAANPVPSSTAIKLEGPLEISVGGQPTFYTGSFHGESSDGSDLAAAFTVPVPAGVADYAISVTGSIFDWAQSTTPLAVHARTLEPDSAVGAGSTYDFGTVALDDVPASNLLRMAMQIGPAANPGLETYELTADIVLWREVGGSWTQYEVPASSPSILRFHGVASPTWFPYAAAIDPGAYKIQVVPREDSAPCASWYGGHSLATATPVVLTATTLTEVLQVTLGAECVAEFTSTPAPEIAGTAQVGATLTASTPAWTPTATSTSYAWFVSGSETSIGTGETLVVPASAVGETIVVRATGSRAGTAAVTVESAPTAAVESGAFASTPAPTIAGTARVGATLTVSTPAWTPAATATTYQWFVVGADAPFGSGESVVVPASAAGETIVVQARGTRDGFAATSILSAPTGEVANGVLATGTPSISGTAKVGETLTASVGTGWTSGADFAYAWYQSSSSTPIGTAATLVVPASAATFTIRLEVTGSLAGYEDATVSSAQTAPVVGVLTSTILPTITGTAQVGATLIASAGSWNATPGAVTYQWSANGSQLAGETGSKLVVGAGMSGKTLTVVVTASLTGYVSATAASAGAAVATATTTTSSTPVVVPATAGVATTGADILSLSSGTGITAVILPGTTIESSDPSWDGTLTPPTVLGADDVAMPASIGGSEPVVALAIEVGDPDSTLTFDQAVRIVLPGQAGKLAGFVPAGGTFAPISTTCVADTQTAADALPAGGECVLTVGSDLVIWTKHFTVFLAYGFAALPTTGVDAGPWAIGGIVLLLVGAGLVLVPRLRRRRIA